MESMFILSTAKHEPGSQYLSTRGELAGILDTAEIKEITAEFGSRLTKTRAEATATIRPPIPFNTIQSYGDALIAFASRSLDGEIRFRSEVKQTAAEAAIEVSENDEDFEDDPKAKYSYIK